MATMKELEERAAHIRTMELAAIDALAAGMRELAVELPDGSDLALKLAKGSQDLSRIVARTVQLGGGFSADLSIALFMRDRMCEAAERLEGGLT